AVPLLNPAVVFPERHVERPMLPILDPPMASDCLPTLLRRHVPATDEEADLLAGLARQSPLHVIGADHLQPWPLFLIANPLGVVDHRDRSLLGPPVPLVLVLVRVSADALVVHGGAQALHDVLAQALLGALDRQHGIAAAF